MDRRPLWYYRKWDTWCPNIERHFDHTNHRQGNITVPCHNHYPKDFSRWWMTGNKNIAKNMEIFNCKRTWLSKQWGRCKLSSAVWTWLPYESSVWHRNISPSLQLTLWWSSAILGRGRGGMHRFVFNIWKPKYTDRQKVEWVNGTVRIATFWINKIYYVVGLLVSVFVYTNVQGVPGGMC
jgi:hypothetical protein